MKKKIKRFIIFTFLLSQSLSAFVSDAQLKRVHVRLKKMKTLVQRKVRRSYFDLKKVLNRAWGDGSSQREVQDARLTVGSVLIPFTGVAFFSIVLANKMIEMRHMRICYKERRQAIEDRIEKGVFFNPKAEITLQYEEDFNWILGEYLNEKKVTKLAGLFAKGLEINNVMINRISNCSFQKEQLRALYNAMTGIAIESQLKFDSQRSDQGLWNFLKKADVVPVEKKKLDSFYKWSGIEQVPVGMAVAPPAVAKRWHCPTCGAPMKEPEKSEDRNRKEASCRIFN